MGKYITVKRADIETVDKLEADNDQYKTVECNVSLQALPTDTTNKSKLIEAKDREIMKMTL